MKVAFLLVSAIILAGCASNTPTSGSNEIELSSQAKEILSTEPSIDITVAAQSLSAWPYQKKMLTYSLIAKDPLVPVKDKATLKAWQKVTEEKIINTLNSLGLTYMENGKGRFNVTYGLTPPSEAKEVSEEMFNDIGLTTGSTTRGNATSIEVSIKDRRSLFPIWSGAVSGELDKPVKTEKTRKRIVYSLLDTLFNKLPVATE